MLAKDSNRQQFIPMMILIAVLTFQSNVGLSDEAKQKHSNVRLQQNEWIQILEQREEIKFEEWAQSELWRLHVKVLFLQYCKASKKKSRLSELAKDPNATGKEIGEAFTKQLMDTDYTIPKFRCNYRTTVFLTLYSSDGIEIETEKTIPIAYKDQTEILPGETIWATFVRVIDPPSQPPPKSWHVWVPK